MTTAECKARFDSRIGWDPDDLSEEYRKCREAQNSRVLAREERLCGRP